MKKFIVLLFAVLGIILSSCENKYVSEGRQIYKKYFEKTLVNPDSFKVYEESYSVDGLRVDWLIDYGAKNKKGEATREVVTFSTYYPDMIDINGELKVIK